MWIGRFLLGLGGTLVAALRVLSSGAGSNEDPDEPPVSLQDCDLIGDYNFRTRRFDAGTDPAGWYEEDL